MCQRIAFVLLAAVFVFFTGAAAAFNYLPWWQALLASAALFVAVVWGTKAVIRFMFRRMLGGAGGLEGMMSGMFKSKGMALRNATLVVHSVVRTDAPADSADENDGDDEAEDSLAASDGVPPKPRRWYAFDVTVSPAKVRHSPFSAWDIDDLVLVPSDAIVGEGLRDLQEGEEFGLEHVRIVDGETARDFDEDKVAGPRRLRFSAGVGENVRAVKFRYYFETFGHIPLPGTP